jgi:hypothetical protein
MLDIHLHPVADGATGEKRVLDAVPVVGPLGDIEDRARGLAFESRRSERARHERAEFAAG